MATITAGVLATIIFLVLCIIALVLVGITNIRGGLRAPLQTQESGTQPVWQKQPKVWFGINNLVFALLLFFVILLTVTTAAGVHTALFICIGLTFLCSLVLVIRSIQVSMQMVRYLQAQQALKKQQSDQA